MVTYCAGFHLQPLGDTLLGVGHALRYAEGVDTGHFISTPQPYLAWPKLVSGTGSYCLLPILNILVLQVGQTPCVAVLPFFMVMALASFISLLARHFTQYACISPPPFWV